MVLLLALVALYIGASFVLSRFLDPEEMAAWLEPRLTQALGRDVELGRVQVGFLPLGVTVQQLTVADPTGLAPELARVGSLELRVEILPLLRREVRVSRLVMEGLRADLRTSVDGRRNYGDLASAQPGEARRGSSEEGGVGAPGGAEVREEPAEAGPDSLSDRQGNGQSRPFRLNLRSIRIIDGEIRYSDLGQALSAQMASLRLRSSAGQNADGAWRFVGSSESTATLDGGRFSTLLHDMPLALSFDVQADRDFSGIEIRTGELRVDHIALGLTGEIRNLKDPVRVVALRLTGEGLPLPDLLALLPDSTRRRYPVDAEGSLAAVLQVEGTLGPGQLPSLTGRVDLTEGRLALDGNRIADELSASLGLNPDRTVGTQVQGVALGGPLSVDGVVSLSDGPSLDLVVRSSPDLARMSSLVVLPNGVTATGQVAAQVRVAGPLGSLQNLRFNGDLRGTGIRATHPALAVPVEVPEAEIHLLGIQAEFADLEVGLGEDTVVLAGEVPDLLAFLDPSMTPRIQASIRSNRLDLPKLSARPAPDPSLTYGKVAFAKVGDRSVGGLTVQEAARELGLARPDALPFAGNLDVAIDTLRDRQGRMEDVRARVEFGPSFIRVPQATFQRYGGAITTSADLTLDSDAAAPFSMNLRIQNLDAGGFLSETTPLGRFVRGRLSVELDLIGTLDGLLLPDRPALVGSGSFNLTGGGLASTPVTRALADFLGLESLREPTIQDWGASFVLDQGWIRLGQGTVQGAPGSPRVGGNLGLGGELDLESVFDLPSQRLSTETLGRLGVAGEVASNVLQRPEVVEAVLYLGGSLLDPTIQADPAATARSLGLAVREEVQREAQAQIDAGKAEAQRILQEQQAEAQRRIQEQKTQLQNRATGFLRGLVQQQDTVRVPLPPDTIRPDTIKPDSLMPDSVRPDTLRPDTIRPDTLRRGFVRSDS